MSSGEQFARVGDIELCYETFGSDQDPALLLVMGLGAQMILWDEPFCEQLAAHGFWVIRFDNRDIGRSTILREAPVPNTAAAVPPGQARRRVLARRHGRRRGRAARPPRASPPPTWSASRWAG